MLGSASAATLRVRRSGLRLDTVALVALLAVVAGITAVCCAADPTWVPPSLLVLPILGGGLYVARRRDILLLLGAAEIGLLVVLAVRDAETVRPPVFVMVAIVGFISYVHVSSRERLGVSGLRGESMLVELRERLRVQGRLPALPRGWEWELEQRSAGGAGFGGDFLVAGLTNGGRSFEVALVDVSGKGLDAGTRALLLSGALGGLLGAVPPEEFLRAANAYLRRQAWEEGFATAIHVAVDLETGEYLLDSAGHPPAAQFRAGSGAWTLSEAEGSALGLFDEGSWTAVRGRLGPGDALLLFTDGLVEVPGRDLELGIDKLLGEAERLVSSTFKGGASRLIDAVAPAATDDRALAMIWRT